MDDHFAELTIAKNKYVKEKEPFELCGLWFLFTTDGSHFRLRHYLNSVTRPRQKPFWNLFVRSPSSFPNTHIMSTAAKVTLGASIVFCCGSIYGVHYIQRYEQEVSHRHIMEKGHPS
jgi:hypothetical protein